MTTHSASKILFVDDDPCLLAALQRNLRKHFAFDLAGSGAEALRLLRSQGPYAVIVADMSMPKMNGVQLLEEVRAAAPDTVRLMLTGNADQQSAVDAVNRGRVYRFLCKPCPVEVLMPALDDALKHHQLLRTERELLEGTVSGSVRVLAEVLGMVAPEALGRGQRLRDAMREMAKFLDAQPRWVFEVGALLSPIGSAAVPPLVLQKLADRVELLPPEETIAKRIPQIGHDLLAGIPRFSEVARIVLYQNKNFDGTGLPADPVAGANIPLGARLLRILSTRLDLESEGIVKSRAFEVMKARAGHFDPELLERSFQCFPDFLANAIANSLPVHPLRVDQLQAGQVLVSEVVMPSGALLVSAGERLTPMVIERLRNFASIGQVKEPVLVQMAAEDPAAATAIPAACAPAG